MFINSPKQFPAPVGDGIELITNGSSSVADLNLLGKISLEIGAVGESAVSLIFGVTNGIKLAKTSGIGHASLYLGQDITDIEFIANGTTNISVFFRIDDEPNLFLENLTTQGSSNISLNLLKEGLTLFRSEGQSNATLSERLQLVNPAPILNEISGTAFQSKSYFARAFKGDQELKIKSFTISAPKNSLGKTISLNLASKNPNEIDKSATNYKFQIGKADKPFDTPTWFTILENGLLESKNYSMAWLNDSLGFGTVSPLSDKLNKYPLKNYILYDPAKIQVDIDDVEKIYDTNGNVIQTELIAQSGLTLYQALHRAFIFGCGFSLFQTNIPNFELTRVDFSFMNSWQQSVAGFIGVFEPVFFAVGNVLWIIDKTQAIPEDFTPRAITPNQFLNWQQSISNARPIDGFIIQYLTDTDADYYEDQIETPPVQKSGTLGQADYTETAIVRTWREWKNSLNPSVVLRRELRREVRSTRGAFSIQTVSRDTEDYFYDRQGKRIETRKVSEKYMPSFPDVSTSILQTILDERQLFYYGNSRFNPRQQIQKRIITYVSGKIAVDSENPYLGSDFKQDFFAAHRAGNLTEGVILTDGPILTKVETFEQIDEGQLQRRVEGYDHIRNLPITAAPEIVLADNSLNSLGSNRKSVILFKPGLTPNSRSGHPLESFFVGEIPLTFAKPLAQRKLANREAKKESGTIELFGYDESIERGTIFAIKNRSNETIGNFMVEGFTVRGERQGNNFKVYTSIEVSEI